MKTIIVLNFTTGEVHIYKYKGEYSGDMEEFIHQQGHNVNNCQWMAVDKLNLKMHDV